MWNFILLFSKIYFKLFVFVCVSVSLSVCVYESVCVGVFVGALTWDYLKRSLKGFPSSGAIVMCGLSCTIWLLETNYSLLKDSDALLQLSHLSCSILYPLVNNSLFLISCIPHDVSDNHFQNTVVSWGFYWHEDTPCSKQL